ncbi:MAG: hypothetical protein AAFY76_15610, partial [Cyanobacteria bacterium J06649_11]
MPAIDQNQNFQNLMERNLNTKLKQLLSLALVLFFSAGVKVSFAQNCTTPAPLSIVAQDVTICPGDSAD